MWLENTPMIRNAESLRTRKALAACCQFQLSTNAVEGFVGDSVGCEVRLESQGANSEAALYIIPHVRFSPHVRELDDMCLASDYGRLLESQ